MTNSNFKWLTGDIDSSLILKIIYKKNSVQEEYAIFNVYDVLEVTGDKLEVETANIDDLTNLLTIGMVRFININDKSDVLDIPFRNLYMLYEDGNMLGENTQKLIPFSKLDIFSVIDGTIRNDFLVFSAIINNISDDLREVMKIASEYGSYGMQEKFDALTRVNMINHRRLVDDIKNKNLM